MTKFLPKLYTLLLALLLFALTPVFIVLAGVICISWYFVQFLAKIFRPDLTIVHPFSSGLAQAETFNGNDAPFNSLAITLLFSGTMSVLEFQERFQKLLDLRRSNGSLLYKEMRQYVTPWCGYTFWKNDDQFDLKNHISLLKTNEVVTKEQLNNLMKIALTKPLKQKRSPWAIQLVHNVKYDFGESDENVTSTAVIFTWSHCLMDGVSFINLLKNLNDAQTNASVPELRKKKKIFQNIKSILFDICLYPFRFFYGASEMILDINKLKSSDWVAQNRTKTTENIQVWNTEFPTDEIKSIKEKFGVRFTSVLIAGFTGAIRQIELKKGASVEKNFPGYTNLALPNHPDGLCNYVEGVALELPTTEPDMVKRLNLCDETLADAAKHAQLGLFQLLATTIGRNCNWIGKRLANSLKAPILISYLPIMELDDLCICGHQLLHAHGFHQSFVGNGCSLLIFGLRGQLRISGVAENVIFKSKSEIQEFIRLVISELQQLN